MKKRWLKTSDNGVFWLSEVRESADRGTEDGFKNLLFVSLFIQPSVGRSREHGIHRKKILAPWTTG